MNAIIYGFAIIGVTATVMVASLLVWWASWEIRWRRRYKREGRYPHG